MIVFGYEGAKANRTYSNDPDGSLGMGNEVSVSGVEG